MVLSEGVRLSGLGAEWIDKGGEWGGKDVAALRRNCDTHRVWA